MRKAIGKMLSQISKKIAPGYIAGPEIEDAIAICRQVGRYGWGSTVCPWDGPDEPPERIAENYRNALHVIGEEKLDCYLSIKAPSLEYDFERIKELLEIASDKQTRVHFDALAPDTASPTFALIEKSVKFYKNLGCTLPSRWKRSALDAERALEMGLSVRIVKGQWPDLEHPRIDSSAHFLELIDILAGRARKVAVASHDAALAKESLNRVKNKGTPCEMEQLFGLPLRIDCVAKPLGISVRLYVPYGYAYLPYALSEIRKRPVILGWMLKDIFVNKNHIKGLFHSA